MGSFNEAAFEQKLLYLKDTHDSIASLSNWCLNNQEHHGKIVSTWLNVVKKVKTEHRLLLFYLANDVIQYSRRKSLPFVDAFAPALQKATTMVREESVRNKILRLFKIWDERGIYDEGFLVDLSGLLSHGHKNSNKVDVADFQPSTLYSRIRKCKQLEDDTDLKLQKINEANFNLQNISALRNSLKHRAHGEDVTVEFDENVAKIKAYINALETEIKDRTGLIDLLETGEQYYEKEFEEARVVVNAYKCFASRVRGVKRKLEEKLESMPSPVPSPDVNAPSPSPEPKDSSSCSVSPDSTFIQDRPEQTSNSVTTFNVVSHIEPIPDVYIPPRPPNFYNTDSTNDYPPSNSITQIESFVPENVSSASFLNDPSFLKASMTTDFLNEFRSSSNIFEEEKKPEETMPPFLSSEPEPLTEGKNIEVIDTADNKQQLALSALLQTLMPQNPLPSTVSISKNESSPFDDSKFNDSWSERDTTWDHLSPASPADYDKAVFTSPFDMPTVQDNDMRYSKKDVDHRNLISLTETAGSSWGPDDTDYRSLPSSVPSQDNVENVDMEMSDEDDKIAENLRSEESRTLEHINTTVVPSENVSHEIKTGPNYVNSGENENTKIPVVDSVSLNGGRVPEPKVMASDIFSSRFNMNNSIIGEVDDGYQPPVKMTPPPMPPAPLPPPPAPPTVWGGSFPRVPPPPPPAFEKPIQNFPHHQQHPQTVPHQFFGRPPPPPKWYPPQASRHHFRPNYRHFHRGGARFDRW